MFVYFTNMIYIRILLKNIESHILNIVFTLQVWAMYQDPEDKSFSRLVTFVSRGCEGSECPEDASPCNLTDIYQSGGGTCCLTHQS
jgi:hypothetical protein